MKLVGQMSLINGALHLILEVGLLSLLRIFSWKSDNLQIQQIYKLVTGTHYVR